MNNKGMTLVEMVLGILILGICATLLVESFTSSAKLLVKATHYKNASSIASSAIDMQDSKMQYANTVASDNDVNIRYTLNQGRDGKTITGTPSITVHYKYKDASSATPESTFSLYGELIGAKDTGTTKLKYFEFIPGNYLY